MVTLFEAKIKLTAGTVPPDSYDSSSGLVPPDTFVVSRNRDGSVASMYGDPTWDRTPYDSEGHASLLHFPFWKDRSLSEQRDLLSREVRWIMFLLMWKKSGPPLSFNTLRTLLLCLCNIARFCDKCSCQIRDILTDTKAIINYLESEGTAIYLIAPLSSILSALWGIGPQQTGLVVPGDAFAVELNKRFQVYKDQFKQHPPLPTRIYSEFIAALKKELDEFKQVADRFLALVVECASDPFMGRTELNQKRISNRIDTDRPDTRPTFQALLQKYDLESFFNEKNLTFKVQSLTSFLADIQMTAKLQIQVYSGMRDDESLELPYHCVETKFSNGKEHCIILGRTTKLNHGLVKRTRWVTSPEGHDAIRVATLIADTIYGVINVVPAKSATNSYNFPLFVSSAYLSLTGRVPDTYDGQYLSGSLKFVLFENLKARFVPIIQEADICELQDIDRHRAWRSESKFQIGQRWHLTTHQLRRSLALYAQRSGLVSLSSLRRQLKHITDEMSRYYARGSAFAKDFIGDEKDHFGREWQESGPISAALSYIINVLFSDDQMFGGHFNWLENRLQTADGIMLPDRDATMQLFKRGEMAYKETFLGGCTNVGECKQTPLRWLDVDCLKSCINLVGKLPKLERAIIVQKRRVESLPPSSVEYRLEKADLDSLIATRDEIVNRHKQSTEAA